MLNDISRLSKAVFRCITRKKSKHDAIAGVLYDLCKSETAADFGSFTTYSSVQSEASPTSTSVTAIQPNVDGPVIQQVELVNEQDILPLPLPLPSPSVVVKINDNPPAPPTSLPALLSIRGREYSLLFELGKGSHGKVMLATDNLQTKDVAIKVIKKQSLAIDSVPLTDEYCHREPIRVSDVTTEIQLLKAASEIGCPFLPSFEYVFQDVDHCYLVMPLLAQSLEDRLNELVAKRTEMDLSDIRLYAAEILLGLEQLHSRGIYHCDLKPGNIMLGLDGHASIVDLSIAQECSGILHGPQGTPGFRAPEVDLDEWYSASAADIYSYGMVLFCMFLCPSTPFNSWYRVCMNVDASPHVFNPEAGDLIKWLLHPNPHKRARIGQIKRHEFFRYLNWDDVLNKEYLLHYTPSHPRTRLSDTPTTPQ